MKISFPPFFANKNDTQLFWRYRYVALDVVISLMAIAVVFLFSADSALAQTGLGSPMGTVMCTLAGVAYGPMGRGLAIIAVIILGLAATLGKASWGMAITVTLGIVVTFSAPALVQGIGFGYDSTMRLCFGVGGMGI